MTYGWALLVIVIVIAILISLNLFSAPQGCNFDHPGFVCGAPVISTNGSLYMQLTNGNPSNIKLVAVVCTTDKSPTAPTLVANPLASTASGYFGDKLVVTQSTIDLTNVTPTSQPICTKSGVLSTWTPGADFSGKIWVFYQNEEDGSNYPIRTATANIVTKTVQ